MPNTTVMMTKNVLERFIQIIKLKHLQCLGYFSGIVTKKPLNLVCSRHDLQVNTLTFIKLSSEHC